MPMPLVAIFKQIQQISVQEYVNFEVIHQQIYALTYISNKVLNMAILQWVTLSFAKTRVFKTSLRLKSQLSLVLDQTQDRT